MRWVFVVGLAVACTDDRHGQVTVTLSCSGSTGTGSVVGTATSFGCGDAVMVDYGATVTAGCSKLPDNTTCFATPCHTSPTDEDDGSNTDGVCSAVATANTTLNCGCAAAAN